MSGNVTHLSTRRGHESRGTGPEGTSPLPSEQPSGPGNITNLAAYRSRTRAKLLPFEVALAVQEATRRGVGREREPVVTGRRRWDRPDPDGPKAA